SLSESGWLGVIPVTPMYLFEWGRTAPSSFLPVMPFSPYALSACILLIINTIVSHLEQSSEQGGGGDGGFGMADPGPG
ncbi:hypothetical protein, partial [Aeromonas veronii]|uniref:hypothetical protein n=1 Tax=Aeromonas veronii TaxID=654 RepID=UPI0038B5B571